MRPSSLQELIHGLCCGDASMYEEAKHLLRRSGQLSRADGAGVEACGQVHVTEKPISWMVLTGSPRQRCFSPQSLTPVCQLEHHTISRRSRRADETMLSLELSDVSLTLCVSGARACTQFHDVEQPPFLLVLRSSEPPPKVFNVRKDAYVRTRNEEKPIISGPHECRMGESFGHTCTYP